MKLQSALAMLLSAIAINVTAAYPEKSIKFLVPWLYQNVIED